MEVWVTGYNFESWLFKDHSCHACFKLAYWFQRKKNKKLVLLWGQLTKIYPSLPTSVQPISITKTLLIVPTKNERDPPLFTGKLLIKFQNILRNTTQVIIRHGKNPIFRQTDGHGETSIPPYNFVAGEIKIPIGSYVKTMSADGDHLRTIHAMFALNWLTGFRGEEF